MITTPRSVRDVRNLADDLAQAIDAMRARFDAATAEVPDGIGATVAGYWQTDGGSAAARTRQALADASSALRRAAVDLSGLPDVLRAVGAPLDGTW